MEYSNGRMRTEKKGKGVAEKDRDVDEKRLRDNKKR
jgi:hypothetical protein